MTETTPGASGTITSGFTAFEPNVLVAGLEAAVVVIVATTAFAGSFVLPDELNDWHWWYTIAGVFLLLAVLLIGLAVEGLAGLFEHVMIRHLRGTKKGDLREWYVKATSPPPDWRLGQRWMWSSAQASHEFARRRMRILVSRNTWFLIFCNDLALSTALIVKQPPLWLAKLAILTLTSALAFRLFVWIWTSAHEGWNKAVADASSLGTP